MRTQQARTRHNQRWIRPSAMLLLFLFGARFVAAQSPGVNLNDRYRFPVSVSVGYQPLSALGNRDLAEFTINEIAGEARLPLGGQPVIQPFVRAGVSTFTFVGDVESTHQDWTHRHFFIGPGVGYSSRISREFEVGAEGFAAITQSAFNELELEGIEGPQGQLNALFGVSARLALNPSYNVSIGVAPSLRYLRGLGPLHTYDGFIFGVGFGASYRFGRDPDAPQADVRALRFLEAEIPPVFAAMQSYYASEPAGTVTIVNIETDPITDLEINFMQPGFMDSPTRSAHYDRLEPGAEVTVPLRAAFNDQVFTTEGVTPLNGEIIAVYSANGRPVEQRHSVTYDLYDRNALTWDDDRKVAAFVTSQDSAVRNYASFIRQAARDVSNEYLSANLQFAMQAYEALAELGILYQIDPLSPFAEVQEDTLVVDSVSLPRETLVRQTGDCDDLAVLYNTLLQSVGIQTAFVTTPGHIFSAFNSQVASREYRAVHPDREMTTDIDGELWIMVETTLVGRAGFLEAWSTGVREFHHYDENTRARRFYPTNEAQQVFRPVALRETDLGLQYGDPGAIAARFSAGLDQLSRTLLQPYADQAAGSDAARDWNAYGVAAAKLGSLAIAKEAFNRALQLDPELLNSRLNLGSMHFLAGEYQRALETFVAADEVLLSRPGIRDSLRFMLSLNISRTCYALEQFAEARTYYTRAHDLDPDGAARFSYLAAGAPEASGATASARAASASAVPILFFLED